MKCNLLWKGVFVLLSVRQIMTLRKARPIICRPYFHVFDTRMLSNMHFVPRALLSFEAILEFEYDIVVFKDYQSVETTLHYGTYRIWKRKSARRTARFSLV